MLTATVECSNHLRRQDLILFYIIFRYIYIGVYMHRVRRFRVPLVDFAMQFYASHNRRNPACLRKQISARAMPQFHSGGALRARARAVGGGYILSRLRYKNSYSKGRECVYVTRTRFHVDNPCKSHIFVVI